MAGICPVGFASNGVCLVMALSLAFAAHAAPTTESPPRGASERVKITKAKRDKAVTTSSPAATQRVTEIAARLAGTLEAQATTLDAYQRIFGTGGDLPQGDFPVAMVVRFSRQGWSETVKQLADALSAIDASHRASQANWTVWSCLSREGNTQVVELMALLNKIGDSQGPIRVQEAIDARRDPVGLWVLRVMTQSHEGVVTLQGGTALSATTLAVFANGSALDGVSGYGNPPEAGNGTVPVILVTDISPSSCQLRSFNVPTTIALAIASTFEVAPSFAVRAIDDAGKEVRSSVVRSVAKGALGAVWVSMRDDARRTSTAALVVGPGRFVPGVDGSRPREQPHLDMAWFGVNVLKLDEAEAQLASSAEVNVVSSSEAGRARQARSKIIESPDWKAFVAKAETLPTRAQLHARAVLRMIERIIASAPESMDLQPSLQAIASALDSPGEARYRYADRRSEPQPDPDLAKARELELRAVRWAEKQARD